MEILNQKQSKKNPDGTVSFHEPERKKSYKYTSKNSRNIASGTTCWLQIGVDDFILVICMFLIALVLEIIGFSFILQWTKIPIYMLLGAILIEVIASTLAHLFHSKIIRNKMDGLFGSIDEQDVLRRKRRIFVILFGFSSCLVLGVAGLKFYTYMNLVPSTQLILKAVMFILYFTIGTLHILYTGKFIYNIIAAISIKLSHMKWQSKNKNSLSLQDSDINKQNFTSNIELPDIDLLSSHGVKLSRLENNNYMFENCGLIYNSSVLKVINMLPRVEQQSIVLRILLQIQAQQLGHTYPWQSWNL